MYKRKEKCVFIAINGVLVVPVLYVSTTLRGLCRLTSLPYQMVSKRWTRRPDGSDRIVSVCVKGEKREANIWSVYRKSVDMVDRRGGIANLNKTPMRGYKHSDGRLHDKPEKVMMGYEKPIRNYEEES